MDYIPKEVDDSVNVSQESPWKRLLIITFALFIFLMVVLTTMTLIIDKVVEYVPVEWEKKIQMSMGTSTQRKIKKRSEVVEQKLEILLKRLLKGSQLEGYPFEIYVVDSKVKNAFIYPGGVIVVYSALIEQMKSENELAFVLAHEVGHFFHRHHLKGLGRGISFYILSSLVMGEIDLFKEYFLHTFQLANLTFSRDHESESDEFALDLVNRYYGHVHGHENFFKAVTRDEYFRGNFEFLSTHPASDSRLKNLEKLSLENGYLMIGKTKEIRPYLEALKESK